MKNSIEFLVGGYADVGEEGVLKCSFDGERYTVLAANAELQNPSWLIRHPAKPLIYAVEELTPEGRLAVLEDQGESIVRIVSVPTKGADPCHIAISPDFRYLLVSNYSSGSLAVYALDEAGLPAYMTDFVQHRMPESTQEGRNPDRQEGPHVHFSHCDGTSVYVNDLGLNQVLIYAWDASTGKLSALKETIDFPAGAGPRHLAFDAAGRHMYVICELDLTIHAFKKREDGGWERIQAVSAISSELREDSRAAQSTNAAIHLADAQTLCASVRGLDLLVVFQIDEHGLLLNRRTFSSGGGIPRDFLPAEGYLLAANQGSGCVQAFARSGEEYVPVGAPLQAMRPTCLKRI